MKASTRSALRTLVQTVLGVCVAVPIFLTTSGVPQDVGAGAAVLAVATVTAKFMNLAKDELEGEGK